MWKTAWPSLSLTQLDRSLKEVEALVARPASGQPDDVTRALSRFLVVRSCGYLEQVVEECLSAYLVSKSDPRSAAYGRSWLGRGMNPSPDRLLTIVGRFDGIWSDELKVMLDDKDQLLRRELHFLVARRNQIAHGLSEGLGARKALDLVAAVRDVTDWFILRFDPR